MFQPIAQSAARAALPLRVRITKDAARYFVEFKFAGRWTPVTNGGSFNQPTALRVYLQARARAEAMLRPANQVDGTTP